MAADLYELILNVSDSATRAALLAMRELLEPNPATLTARHAARLRTPLDGADAQALEHALTTTERERNALRANVERLTKERDEARAELSQLAARGAGDDAYIEGLREQIAQLTKERDEARAQERARIVAWLRRKEESIMRDGDFTYQADFFAETADDIERGEHEKGVG